MEGKRGSECLLKSVSNIDFNPGHGGKEEIIALVSSEIYKKYEITLLLYIKKTGDKSWLSKIPENVTTILKETRYYTYRRFFTIIFRTIFNKYDGIISFDGGTIQVLRQFRKILPRKYKVISWIQYDVTRFPDKGKKRIAFADYHLVLTESQKKSYKEIGVQEDTISVVYNPIGDSSQQITKVDDDKFRLVYIGRIQFQIDKNIEELVKSIGFLYEKGIEIEVDLIGNDDSTGSVETKKIKDLAKQLQVDDKFHFQGYKAEPWTDVHADYLVLTSKSEGFGLVLVESIARGLPVISSDCEAGPKEIVNENNGILYHSGDYQDLANKIEFLYKNPGYFWNQTKLKDSVKKFQKHTYIENLTKVLDDFLTR